MTNRSHRPVCNLLHPSALCFARPLARLGAQERNSSWLKANALSEVEYTEAVVPRFRGRLFHWQNGRSPYTDAIRGRRAISPDCIRGKSLGRDPGLRIPAVGAPPRGEAFAFCAACPSAFAARRGSYSPDAIRGGALGGWPPRGKPRSISSGSRRGFIGAIA